MSTWDERFRNGEYPRNPDPSPILRHYLDALPAGPVLDVATGTGRNAVFLADQGYPVDAIDQSRIGLEIARDNARTVEANANINWIQVDIPSFQFPRERYALITISFYRALDRLPDIKEALVSGGYLFIEHHLRSTDSDLAGPSTDRYRFAANELLHSCLDLTILYYDESSEESPDGDRRATARLVARRSHGHRQEYPQRIRIPQSTS